MYLEILNEKKKPKFGSRTITFGLSDKESIDLFENGETHIGSFLPVMGHCEIKFEVDEVIRSSRVGSIRALDDKKPADLELMKMALKNDYGLEDDDYRII